MAMIKNYLLFLAVCLVTLQRIADAFLTNQPVTRRQDSSLLKSAKENDAAQKLLDQAAKIRAEIAAMEGKSLQEVEAEAQQKKDKENERRQEADRISAERKKEAAASKQANSNDGRYFVQVPETFDDMVRQAARAVERAFQDGKTRQTVRFNLVGEETPALEENEWPGGARQMYREAGKPLTSALLREVRAPTKPVEAEQQRLAPNIIEQDIWDFDGSAIHTAEANGGASGDIQALVFANTDVKYVKDIDEISEAMGPRLFLLVNPFWRNVESWGFDLLSPGAKGKAQKVIFDNGYDETYVNLVFSVRGEKCVGIKSYPYDWQIWAFREDDNYANAEYSIRLGSSVMEPTSALVTQLLNERPEFKETKNMRQMKKLF